MQAHVTIDKAHVTIDKRMRTFLLEDLDRQGAIEARHIWSLNLMALIAVKRVEGLDFRVWA